MLILLVEDDDDTAFLISALLERYDYEVRAYSSCDEAMAHPDLWARAALAVIDPHVRDGEVTAVTVLRWAHEYTRFDGRVLVITSISNPWEALDGHEDFPADLTLGKVFHADDLLVAVRRLTDSRSR